MSQPDHRFFQRQKPADCALAFVYIGGLPHKPAP
jgi:hypothetical protein